MIISNNKLIKIVPYRSALILIWCVTGLGTHDQAFLQKHYKKAPSWNSTSRSWWGGGWEGGGVERRPVAGRSYKPCQVALVATWVAAPDGKEDQRLAVPTSEEDRRLYSRATATELHSRQLVASARQMADVCTDTHTKMCSRSGLIRSLIWKVLTAFVQSDLQ